MALATATQVLSLDGGDSMTVCAERIGFDNLPDQMVREFSDRDNGYCFNIMVLGASCSGKSTLVESLFNQSFDQDTLADDDSSGADSSPHNLSSVRVHSKRKLLEEGAVKVHVSVAVCQGLGDQLDKSQSATSAVDHIESLFAEELEEELKSDRDHTRIDNLVHACVYLLSPTGREVKELDIHMMKQLHKRVHLIPIIGKADSITEEELISFKAAVRATLQVNKIETYKPFSLDAEERYLSEFPLAVVASKEIMSINGEAVRARQYPWGMVEVENTAHSQLPLLRNLLLRDESYYMVKTTKEWMYARYREQQLTKMGFVDRGADGKSIGLLDNLTAKKQETLGESSRRENELRKRYVDKVNVEGERFEKAKANLVEKFEKLKAIHKKELAELQRQEQGLRHSREAWLKDREAAALEANTAKGKKGRSRLGTLTRKSTSGD